MVPGHKGISGNENIDKLASTSCRMQIHLVVQGGNIREKVPEQVGSKHQGIYSLENIKSAEEDHTKWHGDVQYLRQKYNLPKNVAEQIVKKCPKCINKGGTIPHLSRSGPGVWQMDATHDEGKIFIVAVETSSGLLWAKIVPKENAQEIVWALLELAHLFHITGLHTDNRPNFTAEKVEGLCKYLNIDHTTGTPYNPQSQGMVERANQALKQEMDKFTEEVQTIEAHLQLALIALNKKKRGGIGGYTPIERYIHQRWQELGQKLQIQ